MSARATMGGVAGSSPGLGCISAASVWAPGTYNPPGCPSTPLRVSCCTGTLSQAEGLLAGCKSLELGSGSVLLVQLYVRRGLFSCLPSFPLPCCF